MTTDDRQRIIDSIERTKIRKRLVELEKWLDQQDLRRLEEDRALTDMEGYGTTPRPPRQRNHTTKRPRWGVDA